MTKFRIEGLAELEKNLKKVSRATGKNAVRRALKNGGEIVAREARLRAPRLSGDLAESITVETVASRVVPAPEKIGPVQVYAGPDRRPEAIMQEFGTWFHRPQPYMRPAWDQNKQKIVDEVGFSLFEQIAKAVERAERKARGG